MPRAFFMCAHTQCEKIISNPIIAFLKIDGLLLTCSAGPIPFAPSRLYASFHLERRLQKSATQRKGNRIRDGATDRVEESWGGITSRITPGRSSNPNTTLLDGGGVRIRVIKSGFSEPSCARDSGTMLCNENNMLYLQIKISDFKIFRALSRQYWLADSPLCEWRSLAPRYPQLRTTCSYIFSSVFFLNMEQI